MDYIKKREIKLALFNDEMTNICKDITHITALIYEVVSLSFLFSLIFFSYLFYDPI